MPWGWQVYLRGIAPGCHKPSKFRSIWNDSTHMAKKLGIFYATCLWQLYHIIVFGKTLQVPWWCEDSIAITARWVSPVLTVDSTGSRAHLLCEPQTSTDHAEKKGVPSEWERLFAGCGAMMQYLIHIHPDPLFKGKQQHWLHILRYVLLEFRFRFPSKLSWQHFC